MEVAPRLVAMKPGGYEFFKDGKPNSISVCCSRIAKERDWTFQTRKAKGGVEVWRTA